jgi:hypothetical protein
MTTLTNNRYTGAEQKVIAATIIEQLAGMTKLKFMTGAKQFACGENDKGHAFVVFKIGHNAKGVNYVKITLNSMDLYDIEYSYVTIRKITIKHESAGLYADNLAADFEANTGLYLSFCAMGG